MMQLFLIGIGAGAATALLFASVASGSLFSVLLFYLAPLPILIAALGWSHWAALIAAVFASVGLAAVFGPFFFVAFLIGIGLPAWWLGYLALLARPTGAAGAERHRMVSGRPSGGVGRDPRRADRDRRPPQFRHRRGRLPRRAAQRPRTHACGCRPARRRTPAPDLNRLLDFLVLALPPAAAVLTTITNVLNLWLAGRIVTVSGRLQAAAARSLGHAVSVLRAAADRRRDRRLVPARPDRHRRRRARRRLLMAYAHARLRRAASHHARHERAACSCSAAPMPRCWCSAGRRC